jgi:hypothetical protein
MTGRLVVTLFIGVIALAHASDNSDDLFYEEVPQHQPHFRWIPGIQNSDDQVGYWKYKFDIASDKRLGTTADIKAIKASVPSTMSVTIRWISRSSAVVAADCSSDPSASAHVRCLYVVQKHGAKWRVTHHYSRAAYPAIVRSNQSLQPTAGRSDE